jgi:hypothetical protein
MMTVSAAVRLRPSPPTVEEKGTEGGEGIGEEEERRGGDRRGGDRRRGGEEGIGEEERV